LHPSYNWTGERPEIFHDHHALAFHRVEDPTCPAEAARPSPPADPEADGARSNGVAPDAPRGLRPSTF
jgi:hypothetical protein